MSSWKVTTYDEHNAADFFVIENRTEKEAASEAMHSLEVRTSNDWSMEEVENEPI